MSRRCWVAPSMSMLELDAMGKGNWGGFGKTLSEKYCFNSMRCCHSSPRATVQTSVLSVPSVPTAHTVSSQWFLPESHLSKLTRRIAPSIVQSCLKHLVIIFSRVVILLKTNSVILRELVRILVILFPYLNRWCFLVSKAKLKLLYFPQVFVVYFRKLHILDLDGRIIRN